MKESKDQIYITLKYLSNKIKDRTYFSGDEIFKIQLEVELKGLIFERCCLCSYFYDRLKNLYKKRKNKVIKRKKIKGIYFYSLIN